MAALQAVAHRRWRGAAITAGATVLIALALAGCGGSGEQSGGTGTSSVPAPAATSTPTAAASGMIAPQRVAGCAGFTAAAAAQLLGVPVADIKDASSDIYDKLRSCTYASTADSTKQVSFTLAVADSVREATDDMAVLRGHLGVGQRALGGVTGSGAEATPFEEVAKLGDEAVWARLNKTLNVRVGNITVQVAFPEDRAAQEQLARSVVAGLR
jgi:hypothetical protein